jgi:hypothetical protein
MSPRYSIWVSLDKAKNETLYYFKDNSVQPQGKKEGVQYGTPLFYKDGFFSMRDPHDAIVFCNHLNEQEGVAK